MGDLFKCNVEGSVMAILFFYYAVVFLAFINQLPLVFPGEFTTSYVVPVPLLIHLNPGLTPL